MPGVVSGTSGITTLSTVRSTSMPPDLGDQRFRLERERRPPADVVAGDVGLGELEAGLLQQVRLLLELVDLPLGSERVVGEVVTLDLQLRAVAIDARRPFAQFGGVELRLARPSFVGRHRRPQPVGELAVLRRILFRAPLLGRRGAGLALLDLLDERGDLTSFDVHLDVSRLRRLLDPVLLASEAVALDAEIGLLGLELGVVLLSQRLRLGTQRVDARPQVPLLLIEILVAWH